MKKAIYIQLCLTVPLLIPVSVSAQSLAEAMALCEAFAATTQGAVCVDYPTAGSEPPSGVVKAQVGTLNLSAWVYVEPDPCADQTDRVFFTGEGLDAPSTICMSGCLYVTTGIGVAFPSDQTWGGRYEGQGSACPAGTGEQQPTTNTPPNCIESPTSGTSLCYSSADPGCGTVDGSPFCADDVPPQSCISGADGSILCDTAAPEVPDTGVPGDPSPPTDTIETTTPSGSRELDYYDQQTVAQSSNADEVTTDPTPPPEPCDPATDPYQCQAQPACGAPGQPSCDVVIDETGTPDRAPAGLFDLPPGLTAPLDADHSHGLPAVDPQIIDAIPQGGGCQTIAVSLSGHALDIPSPQSCAHLQRLQAILAWALYVFTAFAVFHVFVSRKE